MVPFLPETSPWLPDYRQTPLRAWVTAAPANVNMRAPVRFGARQVRRGALRAQVLYTIEPDDKMIRIYEDSYDRVLPRVLPDSRYIRRDFSDRGHVEIFPHERYYAAALRAMRSTRTRRSR